MNAKNPPAMIGGGVLWRRRGLGSLSEGYLLPAGLVVHPPDVSEGEPARMVRVVFGAQLELAAGGRMASPSETPRGVAGVAAVDGDHAAQDADLAEIGADARPEQVGGAGAVGQPEKVRQPVHQPLVARTRK